MAEQELQMGTKVLIKAEIVRRLYDTRSQKECGYLVRISRGTCMVEPNEIFEPVVKVS